MFSRPSNPQIDIPIDSRIESSPPAPAQPLLRHLSLQLSVLCLRLRRLLPDALHQHVCQCLPQALARAQGIAGIGLDPVAFVIRCVPREQSSLPVVECLNVGGVLGDSPEAHSRARGVVLMLRQATLEAVPAEFGAFVEAVGAGCTEGGASVEHGEYS